MSLLLPWQHDERLTFHLQNFLGEKLVRHVPMLEGVEIAETGTKDEVGISGNDIEAVSQSAASIHTSCLVKNKDIRASAPLALMLRSTDSRTGKFLDGSPSPPVSSAADTHSSTGIYVSHRGTVVTED